MSSSEQQDSGPARTGCQGKQPCLNSHWFKLGAVSQGFLKTNCVFYLSLTFELLHKTGHHLTISAILEYCVEIIIKTDNNKTRCLSKIPHLILEIYLQSLAINLNKTFFSRSGYFPTWTPLTFFHYLQGRKIPKRSLNKFFVLHIPNSALSEVCVNWNSWFGPHFER